MLTTSESSIEKPSSVTRIERGFPGHFCGADRCEFRRNTLLVLGHTRIIVSTVGAYRRDEDEPYREIGRYRFYETCAFYAVEEGPYICADVQREVTFDTKWFIDNCKPGSHNDADQMHERVVAEIIGRMENLFFAACPTCGEVRSEWRE